MKRILIAAAVLALAFGASAQKSIVKVPCNADKTIKSWNNKRAPHSNEETKDEWRDKRGNFKNTSQTVFYLYKADKRCATGQGVIILPGGGYGSVCIEREGFYLAEYLQSIGITAMVVKYRLPNNGHKEVPLEDVQEAMRYMRKHGKRWGVDATKVGVAGSSAGGHLAAYTCNFTEEGQKPAFAILFYPVIDSDLAVTHKGSIIRLLGKDATQELREKYALHKCVTTTTPPTIILLSQNDGTVRPINSQLYYDALKQNGVKTEMHTFESGGHGWVGRKNFRHEKEWKQVLEKWLKELNEQK